MYKVSQSKMKTYRRCRRAYHFKYVEEIRKKSKKRPLVFGTLIHRMIEEDANGRDPFQVLVDVDPRDQKLFAQERAEYGAILEDVSDIMEAYFNYWEDNSQVSYVEMAGRSAEHNFAIEVLPSILFNGKIDGLVRDREGRKKRHWIMEHKSFSRRPNADDRWRNLQSSTYIRANQLLGWTSVDGVCWDYVWSKPPANPTMLPSDPSKISQKKIDSLPTRVRSFLKGQGLSPKKYSSFIKSIEDRQSEWFYRVLMPVDSAVVDDVWDDFLTTAQEMADNHGKARDRNIDKHCSWCDFEPICRAQLQGLDVDYVKERQYEKNDKPAEEGVHVHEVEFEE